MPLLRHTLELRVPRVGDYRKSRLSVNPFLLASNLRLAHCTFSLHGLIDTYTKLIHYLADKALAANPIYLASLRRLRPGPSTKGPFDQGR